MLVEGFSKSDDLNESICLIMKDIKNQGSCTYWILEGLFDEADIVEKKVAMLRYLLEKYFVAIYSCKLENKSYLECVHNYRGTLQFKYRLPIDVLRKYNDHISEVGANIVPLMNLSPEELATYVMPFYYKEIGMWDRQFLRDDAKKISRLSSSWIDKSLQGHMRLTNYQLMRLFLFQDHDPFSYDHGELSNSGVENFKNAKYMLETEEYTNNFCFQLTESQFDRLEIGVDFQKALKLIPYYLDCHCTALDEYSFDSSPLDTDYIDDLVSAGHEAPSKYIPELDLELLLSKMYTKGYEESEMEAFKENWLKNLAKD